MSNTVIERMTQRAKELDKHIVLPESDDPRVLQAAEQIVKENYARVTLLGNPDRIAIKVGECGADINDCTIINHFNDEQRDAYVETLYEKRKAKGMERHQVKKLLQNPVYYGGMMVGDGRADGMVCGSLCPTADTVRSAIYGVGLAEDNKTVSSCSIMCTIVESAGVDGAMIFADTGVVPEPTVEQLADIGIAAAVACKSLLAVEPHVAMISFSTKGSASSPAVEKVIAATKIINERRPQLKADGEMQVDAALIPEIGRRKCPDSPVAGKANTLVFPDLSCGNSAYKLLERLGKATALGPLLLGLAKPINDLSRGCSVEDIVLISAITTVQSEA
ncbi:MAG: phosphate acetyltransferase [Planctomycetes bacterium]|jgi:phosphate acetyltransferase|nr:phosphate acetyltransferase [Planctomycetota bacterium]